MSSKKYLFPILLAGIITLRFPVFADDISDMKASLSDTMTKLIQKYETRIQELEAENNALKQQIASLKGTGMVNAVAPSNTGTVSLIPTAPAAMAPVMITTGTGTYSQIINMINANLPNILAENSLDGSGTVGLFEFINPGAFFISIDDGKNPAWVTAFKTKILYKYDNVLNLTKFGVFDLDYASQRYRTVYGSNPYSATTRTRVPNPGYKGKLLEPTTTVSSSAATSGNISNASTVASPNTEVTFAQVKAAYDSNKLLDALKLSDQYIVKNPNNVEVLRIRYRSYYMIGKYDNSLAEIQKIETIQGAAFERTIACDAAVIGKIAKKTDVSTYYSAICKKQ